MLRSLAGKIRRRVFERGEQEWREHLYSLRMQELDSVVSQFNRGARILDLGAGAGWQARRLERLGFWVSALDMPSSNYGRLVDFPVVHYDGKTIPFDDASFDIVFSSAVLYIPTPADWTDLQMEIRRVLSPGGIAVHGLPTPTWRLLSNVCALVSTLRLPQAIGGLAGGPWRESLVFRDSSWRAMFNRAGWRVRCVVPAGLVYSGSSLLGSRWSLASRGKMSAVFGSSLRFHVLEAMSSGRRAGSD